MLKFLQGKSGANERLVVLLNTDNICASELFCWQLPLTTILN